MKQFDAFPGDEWQRRIADIVLSSTFAETEQEALEILRENVGHQFIAVEQRRTDLDEIARDYRISPASAIRLYLAGKLQ